MVGAAVLSASVALLNNYLSVSVAMGFAAGLRSANTRSLPTFPSHAPRRELDFILYQDGIRAVDPAFLQMFTFPLLKGDAATALADPVCSR